MAESQRVRVKTKLAYGVGASAEAAVALAFNTFNFYFYNNALGLSGTLCGLAVSIALVCDAFSDPLIGSLSDRWRSRLGRRHPFMYTAPVPLGLCFFCIYMPPEGLEGIPLFLWFTTFTVLLRTFQTFYQVPHLALGAELSKDYRERSVVMSYNFIFGWVGGASAFFFGWTWLRHHGGPELRGGYPGLAAVVAIFAAVVIFASAWFTRDQIPRLAKVPDNLPKFGLRQLGSEMWGAFQNRNYLMLLLGLLFLSATQGVRETLNAHVSRFFWELPADKIRFFAFASMPAFILAFIFTSKLHAWLDKRGTIIMSVCVMAFGATTPVVARLADAFPVNGAATLFPLLMFFHFLFYLGTAILGISVLSALADIADEHELTTGRRQEGIFYSARTFFGKLTSGLGHLIAGVAMDIIAFPTGVKPGEVPQSIVTELGIIDGPLASLPALLAILFYARYRIDRARHDEIQRQLAERQVVEPEAATSAAPAA